MKTTEITKESLQAEDFREGGESKKARKHSYWRANWQLYVLILPATVFFLIFSYYPMFGLQIAFKNWNPNLGIWGSHWATNSEGALDIFVHFKRIFNDEEVFGKLVNTLRLSTMRLLFGFPVPIIVVVLMNEMRLFRVKKFVQTLIYLPHFVSWVIIAGILQSFTQTGEPSRTFSPLYSEKKFTFSATATCFWGF